MKITMSDIVGRRPKTTDVSNDPELKAAFGEIQKLLNGRNRPREISVALLANDDGSNETISIAVNTVNNRDGQIAYKVEKDRTKLHGMGGVFAFMPDDKREKLVDEAFKIEDRLPRLNSKFVCYFG